MTATLEEWSLHEELSVRVVRAMRDKRMTQRELAYRIGAQEKHVSRVLNGGSPGSVQLWDAMIRTVEA